MSGTRFENPTSIELPVREIAKVCRRHAVEQLALFGSAISGDFGTDSDVDLLVRFVNDDAGPWMSHLTRRRQDLADLLGRRVDVLAWRGVERSRSPLRRRAILRRRRLLYAA